MTICRRGLFGNGLAGISIAFGVVTARPPGNFDNFGPENGRFFVQDQSLFLERARHDIAEPWHQRLAADTVVWLL